MDAETQGGKEAAPVPGGPDRGGKDRGSDRRGTDRRRTERRTPPPWWRTPMALVAYGVGGTLLLVLAFAGLTNDDDPAKVDGTLVNAPPPGPVAEPAKPVQPAGGAPEAAFGTAGFERLVLQGPAASGRRVRAELYCGAPNPVALRGGTVVEAAVAPLVDADRRVPAAECKWGGRDDARREDFLLLVPADQAGAFSAAQVVSDGFVRRRRLVAEVEWVGSSASLSLRTAGILRSVASTGAS